MNTTESKLVISIMTHGKFTEGQAKVNSDGIPYRHDRGFLATPNDTIKAWFEKCANGSTQFFSDNYSFHINDNGQISFVKFVDLETRQAKITRKIRETKGKFFTVVFTKKDGSERKMTARVGVSKGVKGVGLGYVPSDKGLITVYAMDKLNFRMVSLDTVKSIKFQSVVTEF
jgi:hypothetical protein